MAIVFNACKKANLEVYDSPANIYFDFPANQRDSLLYTFAFEPSRRCFLVRIFDDHRDRPQPVDEKIDVEELVLDLHLRNGDHGIDVRFCRRRGWARHRPAVSLGRRRIG